MDVATIPVEQLCLPGHLLDLTHRKLGEAITVNDFEEAEKASGTPVGPGTALICWTGVDKV
jgi:arylformamidase